ncbi:MAG: GH92 family glycosyl hydrolase [Rikenellaceae bacterium]
MKTFTKITSLFAVGLMAFASSCTETKEQTATKSVIDFVDPFIGTDGIVHTFPGAAYPFGMVQLSPDGGTKGWNWCSGYHFSDSSLMGFSHTHLSGTGWSDLGDILVMPTVGALQFEPGEKANPDEGYRSRFSHDADKEIASAGYYSVELLDYDVLAELTVTPRTGFHRYTFPSSEQSNIIIDPTHKIFGKNIDTHVKKVNDTTIEGFSHSSGWGGDRYVYFIAEFSKPFDKVTVYEDGAIVDGTESSSKVSKIAATFSTNEDEQILVKVAISAVDAEGAKKNLAAEATGLDFDGAHMKAVAAWEDALGKYEFDGVDDDQTTFLYTGLYHAMIQPNLQQDVDGRYIALGKELKAEGFENYSTFSLWDTFRAVHPLFTITEHDMTADFANSLISRYQNGGQIPLWELCGFDNTCMISYPAVSMISDAILKGVPGIDAEKALEAMVAVAHYDYTSSSDGLSGVDKYIELGYVPSPIHASVSKTAENAYYDWCIAQVAKKVGNKKIEEEFTKRSMNFMNHFRKDKGGFLYPKDEKGNWIELDLTDWKSLRPHYISGNIWAYSYFYPHAVDYVAEALGGKAELAKSMDKTLNTPLDMQGEQHVDISGFFGQYGHGDEPGHQFLYMYHNAGEQWKIADWVNIVADSIYSTARNGMPNNDDCGQMSAWYIFSSMGFYPMCPGDGKYIIGAPMMHKAVIHTESGKSFTMIANNLSKENRYIESCTLNGEPLTCGYITHDQIMSGATLVFNMSSTPNKEIFKN